MPCLAFCANCGSERLDVTGRTTGGIQVRCYTCTKTATVAGIILGEVDFLAGAKAKVEQMLERATARARQPGKPTAPRR
jgi:hypothetical protein